MRRALALLSRLAISLDHLQRLVACGRGDVRVCGAGLLGGHDEANAAGMTGEAACEALGDGLGGSRRQ